ncbi:MAG: ester cyclase [SAR202 cluster bacterium]|nr:ester cyclase [SAR202 cluster bacterium]
MSEANKQILRDYTREALIEGNLDAIPRYIAATYVHHLPSGEDLKGVEGMGQAVIAYRKTFKDIDIEIHDMVGEGDRVATRLTVTGTHAGEFMGVPATGKRIKLYVIAIDRFAKGKVAEGWEFADLAGLKAQLTG